MGNIKFEYKEEKNNIIYKKYYFNEIPNINNIKFKNINSSNLNIYWNIENINIINFNNNKI